MSIDLSKYILKPGQYEVIFTYSITLPVCMLIKLKSFLKRILLCRNISRKDDENTFYINRTSQIAKGSSSV